MAPFFLCAKKVEKKEIAINNNTFDVYNLTIYIDMYVYWL